MRNGIGKSLQFLVGGYQCSGAILHTLFQFCIQLADLFLRFPPFFDLLLQSNIDLLQLTSGFHSIFHHIDSRPLRSNQVFLDFFTIRDILGNRQKLTGSCTHKQLVMYFYRVETAIGTQMTSFKDDP